MGVAEKIRATERAAPALAKDFLQRAPRLIQVHVERYLDDRGPPPDSFSRSDRLGAQSGRLSRSLVRGQEGHSETLRTSGGSVELVYRITLPYARAHDEGRQITATSRMIRFFWAKWYSTGFLKWKIIALSAKRKGYIRLRPRPYLTPGLEDFGRSSWPKLLEDYVRSLREVWERTL